MSDKKQQDGLEMNQEIEFKMQGVPMLIVRDMVIMPGANVHFDIQRDFSVKAVSEALEKNEIMFVTMAKKPVEDGKASYDHVYSVGTLVRVKQILKLQKGLIRVMFQGLKRAELVDFHFVDEYYRAEFVPLEDDKEEMTVQEETAAIRSLRDVLRQCEKRKIIQNPVTSEALHHVDNLELLIDLIAESVNVQVLSKQSLLETISVRKRVEKLLQILINEISICDIRAELGEKLKDCVNKNQREYVLREQMKVIRKELGVDNVDDEENQYRQLLEEANPPEEVREKLEKEISRFSSLSYSSSESAVLRNYIETLLEYPWNKESIDNNQLKDAIEKLEQDHYGLTKVKERIVDYLAVRSLSGRKDAPILCLVGPPGTGKTSIAKSIAAAMHKEYARIALGGVRDEAEIRGHRKTYIGAMPGRVVSTISKTGVKNPLILLDEIDKTSSDYKGDVASALLEVLDGEQNVKFMDHYFEVPVDLSGVLFVATANDIAGIPDALRDRMEMIEVNSYTENEKFQIAKNYLVDKQLQKNGLTKRQFKITDGAMLKLIRSYTKEAGVRTLERNINLLMQKTARGIVTETFKSVTINEKKLQEFLGVEKYSNDERGLQDAVGVVHGLAWTRVGGDTLCVEANILDGKGGLTLTGNLGDVMKESAQIALSFIRTLPEIKKLPEDFFEKHIIHLHVPEGATPKDGPSAGITMSLAIYSALTNKAVKGNVAMTGEITLKGIVLPIGGLKEKLLAAKNAGMKQVFVPEQNRKNIAEIDSEIIDGMEIIFVSEMNEVIEQAIAKRKIVLKV
ncbi:MAG: endopeptidase La [Eubacteriales bacterium]|nr:endopeptidase La [Eubacteriales bacterium]